MIFIKNKKADSKLLTPWLFLVLMIIGVGIVTGVLVFYSAEADVRGEEARIISDKIVNAISENGHLIDNIENLNILAETNLTAEKFVNGGDYYFNLTISREGKVPLRFVHGTTSFEVECELPGKELPKCDRREFIVLDQEGSEVKIQLLAGSNNLGEKL